ncbi:MAG: SurA N-terminal domain-containing protein, partial [Acidobacteriota bacterium]
MLDLLRKHQKSWLIKAALVMIALAFVWWGGSMMGSHKDT